MAERQEQMHGLALPHGLHFYTFTIHFLQGFTDFVLMWPKMPDFTTALAKRQMVFMMFSIQNSQGIG